MLFFRQADKFKLFVAAIPNGFGGSSCDTEMERSDMLIPLSLGEVKYGLALFDQIVAEIAHFLF